MTVIALPLAHSPLPNSVHVYLNGDCLRPITEWAYTAAPPTVTLAASVQAKPGDRLEARYAYTDGISFGVTHTISTAFVPNFSMADRPTCPAVAGNWNYPYNPDDQFVISNFNLGGSGTSVLLTYTVNAAVSPYFSDFGVSVYYKRLSTGCIFNAGGSGVSYSNNEFFPIPLPGTVRSVGPGSPPAGQTYYWEPTNPTDVRFVCAVGTASREPAQATAATPPLSTRIVAVIGDFS